MKKLLIIILSLLCFVSCSKDEDNESEYAQYTPLTEAQKEAKADSLYSLLETRIMEIKGSIVDEKIGCFHLTNYTFDNGSKSTDFYVLYVDGNQYGITQATTYEELSGYFTADSWYSGKDTPIISTMLSVIQIDF